MFATIIFRFTRKWLENAPFISVSCTQQRYYWIVSEIHCMFACLLQEKDGRWQFPVVIRSNLKQTF